MLRKIKLLSILIFSVAISNSQTLDKNKQYYVSAVGFWNVENLYDTINDPLKDDEEFLPEGKNAWDGAKYRKKISNLAKVISELATDANPDGLAVLGLCEVENKNVLADLVNDPQLKSRNYQYILIDGPYARGVDPALVYNPKYFKPSKILSVSLTLPTDSAYKTRDILVVSGSFVGEAIVFLVNHWPSRRGGELGSRPNRIAAAKMARKICDSISTANPNTKIVIMGDLNDDPVNASVKKHLKTHNKIDSESSEEFYNPMESLYKQGIGSLAWQDSWNLFDQTIINKPLLPKGYQTFQYYKAYVYNKAYLRSDFGNFKGYPFRTYSGGTYTAGYSDHFPVYFLLVKEKG